MKKIFTLLFVASLLFGCQSEENSVTQNLDSALTKSAPLTTLVSRVCQNPTHSDNILDGTDCYSVQLPVTITLNGHTLTINSENDFDAVEANINASNSDDDIIHFSFPITIIFRDFHQEIITGASQLGTIDCSGSDDFNEIRCIGFVFPITINTYDTNNQIANAVAIHSNNELYQFIQNISGSDVFTIVYPVTLTLSNGQHVSVDNNNDLEDLIEDAIGDCDQVGPNPTPVELQDIVVSGSWHISFCEGGGSGNYDGYNFTFLPNGTLTAIKNSVISSGTWQVYDDGDHKKMMLDFADPMLHSLEDDWKVTEYNDNNFRLKHDNSGGGGQGPGGNEYVYFTKN